MPKESKSKKAGSRLKFEKIDLTEVLKDVPIPTAPPQTVSVPSEEAEQVYDPRMTQVAATPSPFPPPSAEPAPSADTRSDEVSPAAPAHDYVPMAALAVGHVDRMREATNGLLKEPGPPPPGIPRVTKDGESSPPMPTELMQLFTS